MTKYGKAPQNNPDAVEKEVRRPETIRNRLQRVLLRRGSSSKSKESDKSNTSIPHLDPIEEDVALQSSKREKTALENESKKQAKKENQKHTSNLLYCPICLESLPQKDFIQPMINCDHRSCLKCMKIYMETEISESRVHLRCPECVELIHPYDIDQVIGGNASLVEKYHTFSIRRVLMNEPDTRWCPAPDCGYAVIAYGCASCPKLKCERPGCNTEFCYNCKQAWHPNSPCDVHLRPRDGLRFASPTSCLGQIKPCPRCHALIAKSDDGSCNHMNCSMCGTDFCWLCMKEVSDLHFLSPSGCTFWGKRPWSKKKKILCQVGTMIGAPVGILMVAGISVPAIIIGLPIWTGRKIFRKMKKSTSCKRNTAITVGVTSSVIVSPIAATVVVSVGVPLMLGYIYGVVPVSLIRQSSHSFMPSVTNHIIEKVEERAGPSPFNAFQDNSNNDEIMHEAQSSIRRASNDDEESDKAPDAKLLVSSSNVNKGKALQRFRKNSCGSDSYHADNASTCALAGSIAGPNKEVKEVEICKVDVHRSAGVGDSVSVTALSRDTISLDAENYSLQGSVGGTSMAGQINSINRRKSQANQAAADASTSVSCVNNESSALEK